MNNFVLLVLIIILPIIIGSIMAKLIIKTALEEMAHKHNMTVEELKEILKK